MNEVTPHDPNNTVGSAKLVYVLYLIGILIWVGSLIGVIVAYINRSEAPEWLQTHYQFQIRTFWMALLYGLVGGLLTFVLIGYLVLFLALVWLIVRCIKGFKSISRGEAYPNPTTWLF